MLSRMGAFTSKHKIEKNVLAIFVSDIMLK